MTISPPAPNGNKIGPTVYRTDLITGTEPGEPRPNKNKAASAAKQPKRIIPSRDHMNTVNRCWGELHANCGAAMSSTPVRTEAKSNTCIGFDLVNPVKELSNSIVEMIRAWAVRGRSLVVHIVSFMVIGAKSLNSGSDSDPNPNPNFPCEKNVRQTRNHMMIIAVLPMNKMSCFVAVVDD
mmetsp:Transcript_25295/g.37842  ORF Transcript_25295/g.37842 Transcript_25295/m.37842 type:complete len:180 (-) Transcript_25295:325-864(-)